jgi:hypothetical protein
MGFAERRRRICREQRQAVKAHFPAQSAQQSAQFVRCVFAAAGRRRSHSPGLLAGVGGLNLEAVEISTFSTEQGYARSGFPPTNWRSDAARPLITNEVLYLLSYCGISMG